MSDDGRAEPTAVVLRGVPVRLVLRSDDHRRDVLRELALLRLGASPQRRADHDYLTTLEKELFQADEGARSLCGGDRDAAERALADGQERIDMVVAAPAGSLETVERWVGTTAAVGALRPPLLIPPAGRDILTFHHAWAAEVVAQLCGAQAATDAFADAWTVLVEGGELERVPPPMMPVAAPAAEDGDHVARVEIERDPAQVRQARRWLRETLAGWGAGEIVEEAVLPFSELVTNALLHAEGRLEACVAVSDRWVRVEVLDGTPTSPVRRRHALGSATGRGLDLVEMLCTRWGVTDLDDGKRIWFEVDRVDATG